MSILKSWTHYHFFFGEFITNQTVKALNQRGPFANDKFWGRLMGLQMSACIPI